MFGSRNRIGATIIPPTAPRHGRQAPAEREHPPDAHADELRRVAVERRRAQPEPELGEPEEQREQGDEHERHDNDPESCTLIGTPPTSIVRVENGPSNGRLPPPQIRLIRP
jgi:hypothetical protein